MLFYTTDTNEHGLPHDPFKAIVSPRPIGWISTRSRDGAVNLAPYSFFNAISDRPKLVMFSSAGMKDSASFAIESGEFVIKQAGLGGAGSISPSTLENSTVDLSAEFTGLITTQKAYSASSRIITTADQMLEELINMRR